MDKQDELNLKKRYFIWLYKTTKEEFDKYERKFTQLEIDKLILAEMEAELRDTFMPDEKKEMEKDVNDFMKYISEKENACIKLKYKGKKVNPDFIFLDVKLNAIESVIKKELGKNALEEIKSLYNKEMTDRIFKSTEQK